MSIVLRIILIIASLLTILYMMRKIRQSKVQIEDSIFWVIFSVILLVVSIFPGLLYPAAGNLFYGKLCLFADDLHFAD